MTSAFADEAGLFPMTSFPGTLARLPDPAKEDYFAAMKGSRRRQLKKKLRVSAAAVDVDTAVLQHPTGTVLSELFRLFGETYEHAMTKLERPNKAFLCAWPLCPGLLSHRAGGRHGRPSRLHAVF